MRCKKQIEEYQCISLSQMNIIFNSRDFWRKLTMWIRLYLISRYSGFGNVEEAYNHLYDYPSEFTTMLQFIFGKDIKDRYNQLLVQQIITLKELIDAQTLGNIELINKRVNELYQNADEQAKFLSEVNPYWEIIQCRQLLHTYIRYTIAEANYISMGDYANSMNAYSNLMNQAVSLGDYLSLGLFKYMNLESHASDQDGQCINYEQMNTIYQIRTFWFEMAIWTRAVLVGKFTGGDYSELANTRLKQNIESYGKLLKDFFDETIVNEYLQILYNYIDLINGLIDAEFTGNVEEINRIKRLLFENADKRVTLLTDMNSYLDQNQWRSILYAYTQDTIDEISTFISNDYKANIIIFDDLINQASHTADYFSEALYYYNTIRG